MHCYNIEHQSEYGIELSAWDDLGELNALVLAVAHRGYLDLELDSLLAPLGGSGVLIDVCSALDPSQVPDGIAYWSM